MRIFVKSNQQHGKYAWGSFFWIAINKILSELFFFNYNFGFNIQFKIPRTIVYLTSFLTYNRDIFNFDVFNAVCSMF